MSATNRGSKVISQEFYPTPDYTIESILKEIDFTKVNSFTEPCRGEGHIYNKVNVPNKYYAELSEGIDYLTTEMPNVDLILTNPPFSLAQEFITKARTEAKCVIMLQRLNYLGSQARKAFWNSNPPTHIFVLSKRPKFIAKCNNKSCDNKESFQITEPPTICECGKTVTPASDAAEYAFFVFQSEDTNIMYKDNGVHVI